MRADDPWARTEGRETNPLWIAAGILGALFLGYKIAEYMQNKQTPPRSVAPLATPRAITPPDPPNARTTVPTYEPPPAARYAEPVAPTREIYLRKGYSGGMFWSSAICSTQRATIDRIAIVPTSLSWDQQVQVAEDRRQEALPLYAAPRPATIGAGNTSPGAGRPGECNMLEAHIQQLDEMARQPQSGSTQDRIRIERQTARSRQAALRC